MSKVLRFVFLFLSVLPFAGCKDDDGVGVSVQPDEDVLHTCSNRVNVATESVLSDSVLSKYDYFLLGRYRDERFGETTAEFVTQLDARIGGVSVPDTTIVSSSSASSGILKTLLTSIDSLYGDITAINNPSEPVLDSVQFYLQYSSDFFGDSVSLQAVSVYELNNSLTERRTFTTEKAEKYCDKSLPLGSLSYQVQNRRSLAIPLSMDFGKRLMSVYANGSTIKNQSQFNELFKGIYVSHSFNQGAVVQVTVAGVQLFYHYDADITTSYDGEIVTVKASEVKSADGSVLNPLVASVFLSANKSVKRVNIVQQDDLHALVPTLNKSGNTYTYTPAGLYTAVNIDFAAMMDSIRMTGDTSKVMFNSAKLILHRNNLDWNTSLKSSTFLLLIGKDEVTDFFYNNGQPDGVSSFVTSIDTSKNTYTFNITAPLQNKMRGGVSTFSDDLVLVPVIRQSESDNYYYRQQLWLTATSFYSATAEKDSLRPRLDIVYTRR